MKTIEPAIKRAKQMEEAWRKGNITATEYHAWIEQQINSMAASEILEAAR